MCLFFVVVNHCLPERKRQKYGDETQYIEKDGFIAGTKVAFKALNGLMISQNSLERNFFPCTFCKAAIEHDPRLILFGRV